MVIADNQPTPYPDVNEVIAGLVHRILGTLGENVAGVYLFGSLTYGDYNPGRSDIDLLVLVKQPLMPGEVEQVRRLHNDVEAAHPAWAGRVEMSYTPAGWLGSAAPPREPRPYYGEGVLYDAVYGNEWVINNYLLQRHGVTLAGPDFGTLAPPISIEDVQKASIRDLFTEWVPKIDDTAYLSSSHYQSYLVLNLCRILYTVMCAEAGSKSTSAGWVKAAYPEWRGLVQTAESWAYGAQMDRQDDVIAFIRFAVDRVSEHPLYTEA